MAGIANWIVALPIDVGKSRFQTAPEGQYKSLFEVYAELIRKDGIRAFYKGFTPVILRFVVLLLKFSFFYLIFNFFVLFIELFQLMLHAFWAMKLLLKQST